MLVELEKERKKVADMEAVEKERKQREQVKYEQKKKDQMDKFIQIYQKNLELKVSTNSSFWHHFNNIVLYCFK